MQDGKTTVSRGHVLALRLFDISYEIDLKLAEQLWSQRAGRDSARGRLAGTPAKAVSFGVPPLTLDLGSCAIEVDGRVVTAAASARLYDFGIAAFALRLPVSTMSWQDFSRFANATDRTLGIAAATAVWQELLATLKGQIGEALIRPTEKPLQEDYLIGTVEAFDTAIDAAAVLQRLDLVPLLSGRERPLSAGARHDLLRHSFSYYPDDLAVITWDRAFLYEPLGDTDVADVLQIANAQLLEMRVYDELLDAELPRMRDLLDAAVRRRNLLTARRYAALARRLLTLVAEVSELTERVDNALQVTEDVYLARVYAAAMELFRVPNVTAAVDRKLAIIRETYTALHSEAAGVRAEVLEIAVLVLIAVEVILSLVHP